MRFLLSKRADGKVLEFPEETGLMRRFRAAPGTSIHKYFHPQNFQTWDDYITDNPEVDRTEYIKTWKTYEFTDGSSTAWLDVRGDHKTFSLYFQWPDNMGQMFPGSQKKENEFYIEFNDQPIYMLPVLLKRINPSLMLVSNFEAYTDEDDEQEVKDKKELVGTNMEVGKIQKISELTLSKRAKARYVEKKEEESGNITYIYSEKHIKKRNKKKAKKIMELEKSIKSVRKQVQSDISSKEPFLEDIAAVVGLIDDTYERVGNPSSAKEDHHGVTTWRKKHVKFSKGKATIKYVGKSGVGQEKIVESNPLVAALKRAVKDKKDNDEIFPDVNGRLVNLYLQPYKITAKDIRGFHANVEMKNALKSNRNGKLPKDQKEKDKKLKEEFKKALEIAAKKVGHEPATLKNQYLIPSLEENYITSGKIKIEASFYLSKRSEELK
jgi:hypothetical protein